MSRLRLSLLAIGAVVALLLIVGGAVSGQGEEPPPPTAEVFPGGDEETVDPGPPPAQELGEPEAEPEPAEGVRTEAVDAPQGDVPVVFTYQGRLNDGGVPANADYDFIFRIYDAVSGGSLLATTNAPAVTVSNGVFKADISAGGSTFNGQERWLEIAVRPAGGGSYTTLGPRQALTGAPYALSLRPGAVITGSDTLYALSVTNSFANGEGVRSESVTGDSFASYSPGSDGLYVYNPADNGVDIFSPGNAGIYVSSPETDGVYIYNPVDDGLYVSSAGDDGVYIAGSDDDAIYVNGAGNNGLQIDGASSNGVYVVSPGASGLYVSNATYNGVYAYSGNASYYGGYFWNSAIGGSGLLASGGGDATTSYDLVLGGTNGRIFSGGDQYFSATGNDWVFNRYRNGTYSPGIRLESDELGNDGAQISLYNDAGSASIILDAEVGDGGDAWITTDVLQIQGGSDLSERFDVHPTQRGRPEAGLVVCIDAENPGQLKVCEGRYNRTVVGVLSGAGGVQPGLLMGQRGSKADGEMPVALTGRVHVYVDGTETGVQPGDLLTTSDTSGYAMKVTDYEAAQGAILGKAMESLSEGEQGLVLIVVTLQ